MNFAASLTELITTVTDAVLSRKSLLAAVLAMTLAAGCILPIPTPHGKILQGGEVKSSDLAFLKPSLTTKEEVIEHLGKPAIFWRDENTLIYRWIQREAILLWAIGGGYQADFGATDITAEYAFLIKFDAADRFVISETVRKPAMKSFGQFLLDWRDAQRAKGLEGKESMP
jgi:hypothetical protein